MKFRGFQDFLVIAMVSIATVSMMFDLSKIGAGSSPSVHRPTSAQLSALTMPSSPPVQPESLAGSKRKQGVSTKSGARLSKSQLRAEVKKALPKLSAKEADAAVWIIWKESTGRLYARNPRSSSHGLNGFISRSWVSMTKRHGIKRSLEPRAQILALYHYCVDRYGSISNARAFHRRRGWY